MRRSTEPVVVVRPLLRSEVQGRLCGDQVLGNRPRRVQSAAAQLERPGVLADDGRQGQCLLAAAPVGALLAM
jgi:hypothetical protein